MASVTFLAPDTDAFVASVARHSPSSSDGPVTRRGLRIIGSDLYFSNDIHAFLTGDDGADVYMSGPVLLWEHLAAGLVQPLDDFLAGAGEGTTRRTSCDAVLSANRWTGRFGEALGAGPLLAIPVNCESYNLAYVRRS